MLPDIGMSTLNFFPLLLMMGRIRKGKCLYFDMSNIDLACITIDKGECCLDRVGWYSNLVRPLIGGTSRKKADNTRMPFRLHYSVHDLIEGAIATMSDNKIVALSSRFCS